MKADPRTCPIVLVACLWLALACAPAVARPNGWPSNVVADSLLFRQAMRALEGDRPLEGLAHFREILRRNQSPSALWRTRVYYAECLNDAAFHVTERLGVRGPEQSMSTERIALIREAVAQCDSASMVAPTKAMRAASHCLRGHIYEAWGFPIDAYGWFRAALLCDSTQLDAHVGLARVRALLVSHPR